MKSPGFELSIGKANTLLVRGNSTIETGSVRAGYRDARKGKLNHAECNVTTVHKNDVIGHVGHMTSKSRCSRRALWIAFNYFLPLSRTFFFSTFSTIRCWVIDQRLSIFMKMVTSLNKIKHSFNYSTNQ